MTLQLSDPLGLDIRGGFSGYVLDEEAMEIVC